MRGYLQSCFLSVMNRDLLTTEAEGELEDLEGTSGELALLPYFAVGVPEEH